MKSPVVIGEGRFRIAVRVENYVLKTSKHNWDDETLAELGVMRALGNHQNTVELLGSKETTPATIALKYYPNGPLRGILKHSKKIQKLPDITDILINVANGMRYISECNIIHRDLAARNVMVEDNFRMRVGDFGLSKFADGNGFCVSHNIDELPVRHMAVESFPPTEEFSQQSDVWGLGIFLPTKYCQEAAFLSPISRTMKCKR